MRKVLFTLAIAAIFAACGGGGGGGATYNGVTTPAIISSSNASSVASSAAVSLTEVQKISVSNQLKPYLKPQGGANVMESPFAKPIADAIAALDNPRTSIGPIAGSCTDVPGSMSGTYNPPSGSSTGSFSFTFTNYCTGSTTATGEIMNGTLSASGTSTTYTLTMNLTVSQGSSSGSMKGSMSAGKTATSLPYTLTFSATLLLSETVGGVTQVAKMDNFVITLALTTSTFSETISGGFCYDQVGCVTFSTPVALTGSASSGVPGLINNGTLQMDGASPTALRIVWTSGVATYSYTADGTSWSTPAPLP